MPTLPECYRILGVSPKAGIAEIKSRFRLLALKFHPDRNPRNPEAAARFREIAEAYGIVCHRRCRPPKPTSEAPTSPGNGRRAKAFARDNLAEFFGSNDLLTGLPSFGGPDFRYDLQIPFVTAMWGLEKEIAIRTLVPCQTCQATGMQLGTYFQDCPDCEGRGRRWRTPGQLKIGARCEACQGHGKVMTHPCSHCGGQGHRLEWKKYCIVIPPGVVDGTRILFNGQGGEGFQQGPPGHLVVVVHVEPHPFFTRKNNDLHVDIEVSFAQAVLGESIEIPTLLGPRTLELPRGAQSGQSFLFAGLGVPANGTGHPGDLVITVHIAKKARFPEAGPPGHLRQPRSEQQ